MIPNAKNTLLYYGSLLLIGMGGEMDSAILAVLGVGMLVHAVVVILHESN